MAWIHRQPAFIAGLIVAALTAAGAFWPVVGGLDVLVQGLIITVWALVVAWKVRPVAPALIAGVIVAVLDLGARFGFHLSYEQTGAVTTLAIMAVTGVVTWPNVTPIDAPAPGFYQGRAPVPLP